MRKTLFLIPAALSLAGLLTLASAQVTLADVHNAVQRLRSQQEAYKQAGGDLSVIQALTSEATRLATTDPVAAYRASTHGIVLENGSKWDAESELATALNFTLNAKVVGPGESLEVRALFLFDAPAAEAAPYRLELEAMTSDRKVEAALPPGIALGDVRGRKQGETIGLVFDPSKFVGPGAHTVKATFVL